LKKSLKGLRGYDQRSIFLLTEEPMMFGWIAAYVDVCLEHAMRETTLVTALTGFDTFPVTTVSPSGT